MATKEKKPSLTSQIAETLGTADKQEQLTLIRRLITTVETPKFTVVLHFDGVNPRPQMGAFGDNRITTAMVKGLLQAGLEEITRAELQAEAEEASKEEVPPLSPEQVDDVEGQIDEFLKENPDKKFVSAEEHKNKK